MNTPTLIILAIAAILLVMFFFGNNSGSTTGKRVRFSDDTPESCTGNTCGI